MQKCSSKFYYRVQIFINIILKIWLLEKFIFISLHVKKLKDFIKECLMMS